MKVGFIGVGTIASCMIEGFCGAGNNYTFFLSPRNTQKSALLASKFNNVFVCSSNQDVLDKSEVVFLSLFSHNCQEVIAELDFKPHHRIINLIATLPPESILKAIRSNIQSFNHVIPLPAVKERIGPIVVYPKSDFVTELLNGLGTLIFAETMDDIRTMQTMTALMAGFYDLINHLVVFSESKGLNRKQANDFITSLFSSLCYNANKISFDELYAEMTPNGLNLLAHNILIKQGAINAWVDASKQVINKINEVKN